MSSKLKKKIKHQPLDWISKNVVFPVEAGPRLAGQSVGPYLLDDPKRRGFSVPCIANSNEQGQIIYETFELQKISQITPVS